MIKTSIYDSTTRQTIFITEREWVAANGHKVTVISKNSRRDGTILSNINHTSTTQYICECGKKHFTYRNAQKQMLVQHDRWETDAEREALTAKFIALLNN